MQVNSPSRPSPTGYIFWCPFWCVFDLEFRASRYRPLISFVELLVNRK
jgi:hypothetical protein